MNCCNNLNSKSGDGKANERLAEDVTTTIGVSSTSTILLNANANRRIIKIYNLSQSVADAEVWIKYGSGATLADSAHPLLPRNLLVVDSQAANAISAVCSVGTAQLRVSSVEVV